MSTSVPGNRSTPPPLPNDEYDQQGWITAAWLVPTVLVIVLLLLFLLWPDRGPSGEGTGSVADSVGGAATDPGGTGGSDAGKVAASGEGGDAGAGAVGGELPTEQVPSQGDHKQQASASSADEHSDDKSGDESESAVPADGANEEETEAESLPENRARNQFFTVIPDVPRPAAAHSLSAVRSKQSRQALVRKGGGTRQSERAVRLALEWLAAHQESDGSWSFDHTQGPCNGRCANPGMLQQARNGATAMALLPFLGAGETHQSGDFQSTVKQGLDYLCRSMQETEHGGVLVDQGNMYSHGLAAIVLSEAFSMTRDDQLAIPAQRALDYIMYAQDPTGGGWRYAARQRGDTSVVGWQIMALKSGTMAYLKVDPLVFDKAGQFLDSVQQQSGALYGYTGPGNGQGNGQATTAIGLLCRMYLGWHHNEPALRVGIGQIAAWGPSPDDMYYNYYATQAMFQYSSARGQMWSNWNTPMRDALVDSQSQRGHEKGSWFMASWHASSGGRLYCTSLATLILEVYYRHMPIFQESATAAHPDR